MFLVTDGCPLRNVPLWRTSYSGFALKNLCDVAEDPSGLFDFKLTLVVLAGSGKNHAQQFLHI
ncbi:MAG: hypothetical protein FWC86_03775 [Coriobacteriia bacterium]|nr:hypothetical protein [Coriobacteriia bacterium]